MGINNTHDLDSLNLPMYMQTMTKYKFQRQKIINSECNHVANLDLELKENTQGPMPPTGLSKAQLMTNN